MTSRCVEFEELIDREAHGWSEAERLRVEHHLNDCEECRATLGISRVVRDAIEDAARGAQEASIDRALARAFAASASAPRGLQAKKTRVLTIGSTLLAVAAAVALLVWTTRDPAGRAPDEAVAVGKPVPAKPAPEVESQPAPLPEPTWIETEGGEVRTFAHAHVKLSPRARVRFDDAQSELHLERGSVEVSVDPAPQRAFRVSTQHFRVEVLGTKFVVDEASVSVLEGRVRVVDHEGQTLSNELGAGGRFTFERGADVAEPIKAEAPAASARVAADALLNKARAALARGATEEARSLITRAETSKPRRADKAEATTLRAELALVERDAAAAIRFYERVAKQYGDLTAGENAAFAAAQVAARSDASRARALFTHYLTRYPHGRFSGEAQKRLAALKPE